VVLVVCSKSISVNNYYRSLVTAGIYESGQSALDLCYESRFFFHSFIFWHVVHMFLSSPEMLRSNMIHSLLFIQILARNIILRHLVDVNFHFISVLGVFHALHNVGFERVPFLEQLIHTLRICSLDVRQSLQIS
jgi:hypothetical protein